MRNICQAVAVLLVIALVSEAQPSEESVKRRITDAPLGARIEVHLKSNETLRGTRGEVSETGFTLTDAAAGSRQIAFADVDSVKRLDHKSRKTRNILIIVGVGVVAAVAVIAIYIASCGPFGCGSHPL